jgi:polyphosphate kinase
MILLDNILRYCLDDIFKGFFDYDALNAYSMKMTRDAEYDLVHEMEASLMELMSSSLKQRLTAEPVRLFISVTCQMPWLKCCAKN